MYACEILALAGGMQPAWSLIVSFQDYWSVDDPYVKHRFRIGLLNTFIKHVQVLGLRFYCIPQKLL